MAEERGRSSNSKSAMDMEVTMEPEKKKKEEPREEYKTNTKSSSQNHPTDAPTWHVRCPYCKGTQGRCATTTTSSTRSVTECCSCGRVVEERHSQFHQLFHVRAQDTPLCLVTSDLNSSSHTAHDDDPFLPTGFITAFSTWSLEPVPVFARSSFSFAGHLAELERVLGMGAASVAADGGAAGPNVSVDHLRAYVQILDVSSILDLDQDIADHAFQLFRDCSSTTCLRNRSVEALATAALVQAIREAQEPRTLQEISAAANLPQKEIGKYIKILGEALKLSQPINSNSIAVHMPRFCTLLQLNKSAQELAAHIGEVVINKCFCTRRNPISISAAAIYLACQLEDKRKTQAEICKVTGLTEVTLRKVYKELLENWDDLLPTNYTPAVPPEKAFPMTTIPSGRSSTCKMEPADNSSLKSQQEKEKQQEVMKQSKFPVFPRSHSLPGKTDQPIFREPTSTPSDFNISTHAALWQTQVRSGGHASQIDGKKEKGDQCLKINETKISSRESDFKIDSATNIIQRASHVSAQRSLSGYNNVWPFQSRPIAPSVSHSQHAQRSESSSIQGGGTTRSKSDHIEAHDDK